MATAVAFLLAYAWPILHPALSDTGQAICDAVTWAAWVAFAIDYLVRVGLAEQRGWYVLRHLHDLAVIALPLLRPLRLLRLITVIAALNRRGRASLRGRVAVYVAGATTLLAGVAALAVLDAERSEPDANITSFGDALWWAASTITTVGYGDRYPTTVTGRLIAVGLMLGGIALVGVVTATLASWLLAAVRAEGAAERFATAAHVEALAEETRALRDELGTGLASADEPGRGASAAPG